METENCAKPTSIQQVCKPSLKNTKVEVWDLFIRLFHWSLAAAFAVTYITGEEWRKLHVLAGYTAMVLTAARLLWGSIGTPHARFRKFVKSPTAVARYIRDVFERREARHVGHNPAGGAMIVVMLALLAAVSASGVLLTTETFWGSETVDTIHGTLANVTLICVAVHVSGVIFASVRTHENLVWSMISGRKRGPGAGDVV